MSFFQPKMVLLSKQTASNSASIAFTSVITSAYSTYYLVMRNYIPATDATDIYLTLSTDNGATYLNANYQWSLAIWASGGITATNSSSDSKIKLATVCSNSSSRGLDGEGYLYNLNSGTYVPMVQFKSCKDNSNSTIDDTVAVGDNTGVTAITAIKVASSSGNITSGNFYFYGVIEP